MSQNCNRPNTYQPPQGGYPVIDRPQRLPAASSPADIEAINYSINDPDQSSLSDSFDTEERKEMQHMTQQIGQNVRPVVRDHVVMPPAHRQNMHISNANPHNLTPIEQNRKLLFHQKEVKSGAWCTQCCGYIMAFMGFSTLLQCFGITLMGGGSAFMSSVPIETDLGTLSITIDSSTINWFIFLKVVSGIFILIQARGAIKIFSPILKAYRTVESGAAHGISMNERKAPKMKAHLKLVKRLTCGHIIVFFFCILATRSILEDISDQVIDQYHTLSVRETASTNATSIDWDRLSEPMEKNLDEDEAHLNPFSPEEESNETPISPEEESNEKTGFDKMVGHLQTISQKVARNDQSYSQDPNEAFGQLKDEFDDMTPEDMKQVASNFISLWLVMAMIGTLFSLAFWQGIYIYCLKRAMTNQAKLEDWFMGPIGRQSPAQVAAAISVVHRPPPVLAPSVQDHRYAAIPQTGRASTGANSIV